MRGKSLVYSSKVFQPQPTDIWGCTVLCWGAALGIIGCLPASLNTDTHLSPPPPTCDSKKCLWTLLDTSVGGGGREQAKSPHLRTVDLEPCSKNNTSKLWVLRIPNKDLQGKPASKQASKHLETVQVPQEMQDTLSYWVSLPYCLMLEVLNVCKYF